MRRLCILFVIIISFLMFLTGCEKSKDIVHLKTSEKEITIFSEENAEVRLKITVKDTDKEEVFNYEKLLCQYETSIIKVNEIADSYLTENAVITDAVVEEVYDSNHTTLLAFIVFISSLTALFIIVAIIVKFSNR